MKYNKREIKWIEAKGLKPKKQSLKKKADAI